MILYNPNIELPRASEVIQGLAALLEATPRVVSVYLIPIAPVVYDYEPPAENLPGAFILIQHKQFMGGQRVPTSGRIVTTLQVKPHVKRTYKNAFAWVDEAKQRLHETIVNQTLPVAHGEMLMGFNWETTSGTMYHDVYDTRYAITEYQCVQVPKPIEVEA